MDTNEDERSYTIPEFCRLERISAPTFYKLKRLGLGPREMRGPLNIVRISHAARLAWQRAMEEPSFGAQKAEAEMRARALVAVKKAVASPSHPSRRRAAP